MTVNRVKAWAAFITLSHPGEGYETGDARLRYSGSSVELEGELELSLSVISTQLAEELGCHEETARRIFEEWEEKGLVEMVSGGKPKQYEPRCMNPRKAFEEL